MYEKRLKLIWVIKLKKSGKFYFMKCIFISARYRFHRHLMIGELIVVIHVEIYF